MDSTSGLRFADEERRHQQRVNVREESMDDEDMDYTKDFSNPSNLDDVTQTVGHTLYMGAKEMRADDIRLARETLSTILDDHNHESRLGLNTILAEYYEKHSHLIPKRENTLSYVQFGNTVEHPQVMHARYVEERKLKERNFLSSSSGRALLGLNSNDPHGVPPNNWEEKKKEYLSDLKIKHAKDIMEQQRKYRESRDHVMQVGTVIYSAATTSLKRNVETMVTPQNLINQMSNIFSNFGYRDVKHFHDDFTETHGNAVNFIASFSQWIENPFFKLLKGKDHTRFESPYFHDWAQEQQRINEIRDGQRAKHYNGRRLLQMNSNEDKQVSNSGSSSVSLGGMAILSSLNCQSSPKNPLCIPEIPANFSFAIPRFNITQKTKNALLEDVNTCSPWINTYCIVCWERFYNAFEEFRFLLSAIPPVNYFFSTLTTVAPWTGIFFNWIFIVPKYHNATVFQWVCFAYHLFDVFVTGVIIFFILKIVFPLLDIFIELYNNFKALKLPDKEPYYQKQVDRLELAFKRWKERSLVQARIGHEYFSMHHNPQSQSQPSTIVHHHHYHSSSPTSQSSPVLNLQQNQMFIGGSFNNRGGRKGTPEPTIEQYYEELNHWLQILFGNSLIDSPDHMQYSEENMRQIRTRVRYLLQRINNDHHTIATQHPPRRDPYFHDDVNYVQSLLDNDHFLRFQEHHHNQQQQQQQQEEEQQRRINYQSQSQSQPSSSSSSPSSNYNVDNLTINLL